MLVDPELNDSKVLICDDVSAQAQTLKALLHRAGVHTVETVTDPRRVLPALTGARDFRLLLLDLEMHHLSGLEVIELLRSELRESEQIPIILIIGPGAGKTRLKALELGATDVIQRPFENAEAVLRVRNVLRMQDALVRARRRNRELEDLARNRTNELELATEAFVRKLATVCELHDKEAAGHCIRVGRLARMLAELAGLPEENCFMIERAAPLHDVGNVEIPDEILLKPGKLTEDEFSRMKHHAAIGSGFLGGHESLLVRTASTIAASHHERWDGSGYPNGLRGESIPIEGRITAICDVFDALSSRRPYKDPWTIQNAVEYLVSQSAHHFDPKLIELFVANLARAEAIRDEAQSEPAAAVG